MEPIQIFSIGSFAICLHHLVIAAGLLLCLSLAAAEMKKAGIKTAVIAVFVPASLLFGFFFAHLFYCLARFDYAMYDLPKGGFFMFWDGHYMLYGGVAGVLLAAWISSAVGRCRTAAVTDSIAPFGALMIAFVRAAEGLSGQGCGEYLADDSKLAFFPFAVCNEYDEWVWALFVAACVVALVIFVVVVTRKNTGSGDRTLLMLGLYASFQVILESLRRDDFLRWGFIRVSQLISAFVILFVLICYARRAGTGKMAAKTLHFVLFASMVVFVILLEFASEGRISFLRFLSPEGCYVCMTLASIVMAGCVLSMRRFGVIKQTVKQ